MIAPTRSYLPAALAPVKAHGAYQYFDRIQFRPHKWPDASRLRWLERECAGIQPGEDWIALAHPPRKVLLWMVRSSVHLTVVEVAVDLIFESRAQAERQLQFVHHHRVRNRRGSDHPVKIWSRFDRTDGEIFWGDTSYDDHLNAPNLQVAYCDLPCRLTQESDCLHLEWRLQSAAALRRAKIKSAIDLLTFDHRAFWEKRLRFYSIDKAKLGRLIRNAGQGSKSRRTTALDLRTGHVTVNAYNTVQELIDGHHGTARVRRALVPVDVSCWFLRPPRTGTLITDGERITYPGTSPTPSPNPDNNRPNPDRVSL